MFFVTLFSTISVVPIIVSASLWDSDSESSSNPAELSNLALLPLDQTMSLFEPAQSGENSDLFSFSDMSQSIIPSDIAFDGTSDLFPANDAALIPFFPTPSPTVRLQ